jgi:hypothetical protein
MKPKSTHSYTVIDDNDGNSQRMEILSPSILNNLLKSVYSEYGIDHDDANMKSYIKRQTDIKRNSQYERKKSDYITCI